MHPDQTQSKKILEELQRPLNTKSTTVQWLNRQTTEVAEQRLWDIMEHNIASYKRLIEYVGTLPQELRMVRLGSDCLPVYTEPTWRYYWQLPDVASYCEREFSKVGETARRLDVRLSFHPGQFCCIVSENPGIVERSLKELEYHADMARWMGYGLNKLDFKINVHLSGKQGVEGFNSAWMQMSPELRNCLTLENDEYQIGLAPLVTLKDKVGIVLDVHHHLIKTHEYIMANDDRIKHVIDSWQGCRPVIHYSQSREDYLIGHDVDKMIDIDVLLTKGFKKAKLRSHSDFMWNRAVNQWARQHWEWADVMVESKGKNLSAGELVNQWQESI